ncbi:MAG: glycosyltransferase family 4 protein [Candidatus Magasanikbacteria bacterium]|nr:glycosyltransferase family 4 protein [Candidatus Magasanikbacteria bacterium]
MTKEEAKQKILEFSPLAQNNIKKDSFLIGTIANFYKTKGLNILIESFKKFIKTNPNSKLIIIGDGPERNSLAKQIQRNNLNQQVILTGTLPNAHQYLKALDIFVLSSIKEGFPYAILEAMAAQVPIITTSVGSIPEILKNEENALIIQPSNSSDLASSLDKLIKNPQLAQKLSEHAHQTVKRFNLADTIQKTSSLY